MPLTGPTLLALRPFKDAGERSDATLAAAGGADIGTRPDFWRPYEAAKADVLRAAKSVTQLKMRFPSRSAEIDAVLTKAGRKSTESAYLPVAGRNTFWTAFVDPVTADVVGFLPLDPY
jgi:hypothetical protein